MHNLEKAKEIIKENYDNAKCGIYDCRNIAGDYMSNIYDENGLTIDICYEQHYFEVFGLTDEEFSILEEFYRSLKE